MAKQRQGRQRGRGVGVGAGKRLDRSELYHLVRDVDDALCELAVVERVAPVIVAGTETITDVGAALAAAQDGLALCETTIARVREGAGRAVGDLLQALAGEAVGSQT